MMHYIRIVIGTVLFPYYRWRRFLSLVALLLLYNIHDTTDTTYHQNKIRMQYNNTWDMSDTLLH
jgi:hypothetical protein